MATDYVVDTHALVWFLEGNPRLSPAARAVLEDPANHLTVPAIVVAEACWMIEHGKTTIPSAAALFASLAADVRVTVAPLDVQIVQRTVTMDRIDEMHDRQIVATTQREREAVGEAILITRDSTIRDSGLVPTLW